MEAPPRRLAVAALATLLLLPATAGCLTVTTGSVIVAASAPKASGGMTVFIALQPGLLDRVDGDQRAEYAIYHGSKLVYPLGGKGATFTFQGRSGSVFVPYNLFVVGNGDYDVVIRHDGDEYRTRVGVQKWANYVFVKPFDRGSHVRVEAVLSTGTGAAPDERVLAKGDLLVDLVYRGLDGSDSRPVARLRATTEHDQAYTRIDVPRSRFSAGPGYYSFEPIFHNGEARNNVQVPPDPSMAYRDPPANWIHITR